MTTNAIIGEIGGRLDILLKVGTTVGPFLLKFPKPDGTYTSLTGFTLRAKARTRNVPAVSIAMSAVLANPASYPGADWVLGGAVLLSATKVESAKFESPTTMTSPPKIADWDFEIEAPDGTLTPMLYGEIRSYLRLPVTS